jgi:hypothetical protein
MDLHLVTYGIGQKSGTVSISQNDVTFSGKSIQLHKVESISFSLKSSRQALHSTVNATINIRTNEGSMVLKFSGSDGMLQRKFEPVLASFISIRTQLIQHIGPLILNRMLQLIDNGETLRFTNFIINHKGITSRSMLKGEQRAGWEEDITVLPKEKSNTFVELFNSSILSKYKHDYWEIVYHNKYLGKIISLGEFSYEEENGCIIPFLVTFIKQHT